MSLLSAVLMAGCITIEEERSLVWEGVYDDQGIPSLYKRTIGVDDLLMQYYIDWATYETTKGLLDKQKLNAQLRLLKIKLNLDRI